MYINSGMDPWKEAGRASSSNYTRIRVDFNMIPPEKLSNVITQRAIDMRDEEIAFHFL